MYHKIPRKVSTAMAIKMAGKRPHIKDKYLHKIVK